MLIIAIVAAAVLAAVLFSIVKSYHDIPGTSWFTAFRNSATHVVAKLTIIGSTLLTAIYAVLAALGDTQIQDAIKSAVEAYPQLAPIVPLLPLILAMAGVIAARNRSLGKD